MYERFTDRARKVMQLANQEAQRFNHEYVGTEHILIALAKEGSGVAANVLKNLGLDLRALRTEVEKLIQAAPEMVIMGNLPMTPRAKKVIEYAIDEARGLGHNYVGTEHLLLGLIREGEGVAAHVLVNCDVTLEDIRQDCFLLLGHDPTPVEKQIKELNRRKMEAVANQCFEQASDLQSQIDHLKQTYRDQQNEVIRQITCAVLAYWSSNELGPDATLEVIKQSLETL